MYFRILLFLFLLTFFLTDDVNAGRGGGFRSSSSRGSSSRGSSWSSPSRSGSSSGSWGSRNYGSSSGGHTTSSGSTGHGSSPSGHTTGWSSSTRYGSSSNGHTTGSGSTGYGSSSGGHMTGSDSTGYGSSSGGHVTGSSPFGHGSSSGGRTTGSNPPGTSSSQYIPRQHRKAGGHQDVPGCPPAFLCCLGQTSHRQNKDASSNFLTAEGGGARQPQTSSGSYRTSSVTNENKQNSVPHNPSVSYNPSAPYNPYSPSVPPTNHLPKATVVPSQSHAPTSFGQPSAPNQPSQGTASSNPSWSNPHFNPSQSYPPGPASTNIGFKDHMRPTSMPVPSAPYPRSPYPSSGSNSPPPPYPGYPIGHSNQHYPSSGSNSPPPPYPGYPIGHSNQHHSTYNPSYSAPSQTFGHPSGYPAHIPPPAPGTYFGNPYSTHPIGGTYGAAGHNYYPQQHVLAQPASQPYIPGQTVMMVQQDSGRGFGQMVKEALVFSTINAGVNRLINPHPHYVRDYGSPATSGASNSETHITYNNHYFNTAPEGSGSSASPYIPQGNVPVAYPANPSTMNSNPVNPSPVNNPVITPGVSIPVIVSNGSTTYPVGGSSVNTVATANNAEASPPVTPNEFSAGNTANNQGTDLYTLQYKISDDDLLALTEELFVQQEINISKYLTLHLQSKSANTTDAAMGPLIYVEEEAYDYPTILAIRALYDTYEHNSTVKETRTPERQKKEDLLLDLFLNTNVMVKAMRWLSARGFIDPNDFDRKDTLRHIWFTVFGGSTSGFERVFTSERYDTELLGVQDWIYFNYQESKKRIDYMGYVDTMKLGDRASLVKLNFQMDGIVRPNATIFVGTLPELEMSLYTICFYARPNDLCPVSLGGNKFNIFTHSFRYYGKDVIDLALPIF